MQIVFKLLDFALVSTSSITSSFRDYIPVSDCVKLNMHES